MRENGVIDITVVVPVYNRASVVARSIASIKNLKPLDVTVVVVDDGSIDNTVQVCREEIAKQSLNGVVYELDKNKGPAAARNRGMELVDTTWMMFLDSDDEFMPEAGAIIAQSLSARSDVTMHSFGYVVNGFPAPSYSGEGSAFRYFLRKKYFNTNTCVLKVENIRGVFFKEEYRVGEDTDFWARLLFASSHVHSNDAIAKYNLEHKAGVVQMHPFYHVTLPQLDLPDAEKAEILAEHEGYMFRQKASSRLISFKEVVFKKDVVAVFLYVAGPAFYGLAWRLNRWIRK